MRQRLLELARGSRGRETFAENGLHMRRPTPSMSDPLLPRTNDHTFRLILSLSSAAWVAMSTMRVAATSAGLVAPPSAFGIDDDDHRFTRELIEIERTQTAAWSGQTRELIALECELFLKVTVWRSALSATRMFSDRCGCAQTNAIRRRKRHVAREHATRRSLAQEPRSPRLVQPD